MELSPAVDVPVTVNTEWTGPNDQTVFFSSSPTMVNLTRYTSILIVSSFGRDESGVYNCTSTVTSNVSQSDTIEIGSARVTVGMLQ